MWSAERCFAANGFEGTRLEDVGRDVGLGRPGVLYHFKGKLELYRAVLDEVYGSLFVDFQTALAGVGTLNDRIEDLVRMVVRYVGRRPTAARLLLHEVVSPSPRLREATRAQAALFLNLIAAVFEEGKRAGVLRPVVYDAYHFASTIVGAVTFHIVGLPALCPSLSYDPLSDDQLRLLEEETLQLSRTLLGTHEA
jgi:AcrR family transcriptional regulator